MTPLERPFSVFATHPERGTWRVYGFHMTEEEAREIAAWLNDCAERLRSAKDKKAGAPRTTYEARGYYWRERRG